MKKLIAIIMALVVLSAVPTLAATLNAKMTVDNGFVAFLSTSDYSLGTQILSGTGENWKTAFPFSAELTSGTYYLHVFAYNTGSPSLPSNPGGFLGEFTLTGTGYSFANGTQSLYTGANSYWRVGTAPAPQAAPPTVWTSDYNGTLKDIGKNSDPTIWFNNNGHSPVAGISPDASWIWTTDGMYTPRYFSTTITANAVPEASSIMLALCGLGTMGGFKGIVRRIKK